MVRLVSETSLFPLDTLVRDGITAGHHWPALYFLSGLTKLTSVPFELLNKSLKEGDNLFDKDDNINLMQQVLDIDIYFTKSNAIHISFKFCLKPSLVISLLTFSLMKMLL